MRARTLHYEGDYMPCYLLHSLLRDVTSLVMSYDVLVMSYDMLVMLLVLYY